MSGFKVIGQVGEWTVEEAVLADNRAWMVEETVLEHDHKGQPWKCLIIRKPCPRCGESIIGRDNTGWLSTGCAACGLGVHLPQVVRETVHKNWPPEPIPKNPVLDPPGDMHATGDGRIVFTCSRCQKRLEKTVCWAPPTSISCWDCKVDFLVPEGIGQKASDARSDFLREAARTRAAHGGSSAHIPI